MRDEDTVVRYRGAQSMSSSAGRSDRVGQSTVNPRVAAGDAEVGKSPRKPVTFHGNSSYNYR